MAADAVEKSMAVATNIIDSAAGTAQPSHPELGTPRLMMRPMVAEDVRYFHSAFSDPEAMRFMDFPVARSLDDSKRYLSTYLFVMPEWHATWSLVCRETGAVIGFANYHHRENWNRRLEIGFMLHPAFHDRGFMAEALATLLAFCFEELPMQRIEATTSPENARAIRLIEKLGFRCEGGPMRRRQCVGNEFRDLSMYGLVLDDWRSLP
jgi:ribosomal-protein-alanine N-acetyltransferase